MYYETKGIRLSENTFKKTRASDSKWRLQYPGTAFQDRIEITSIGTLPPGQTKEGFFAGVSVPVNEKLAEIFVQLHISERSGRGVPKIVEIYGEKAFKITSGTVGVAIPYDRLGNRDVSR